MKKLFLILAVLTISLGTAQTLSAQDGVVSEVTEAVENGAEAVGEAAGDAVDAAGDAANAAGEAAADIVDNAEEVVETSEAPKGKTTFVIKEKFIEGDWLWMTPLLICLILGLAIAIERIIYLNMSSANSGKLLIKVESALKSGGLEAAKDVCRKTSGPVASIFYQGLDRSEEGIEQAEKGIVGYGGVMMGQLEKGLVWISLFIALAPMIGFMGTVVGMISAFDSIEAAGDISPKLVAGGIKVALLTTVGGLIVAVILQIFYNYIVAKTDSIVNDMEESSIHLVDLLVKHKNR